MKVAIVDNGTDCLPQLMNLCSIHNFSQEVLPAHALRKHHDFSHFDLILLSGGIWYDEATALQEHYGEEVKLIAQSGTPIIGVCLGMLLICIAFGGTTHALSDRVEGPRTIAVTAEGAKHLDGITSAEVFENHSKDIVSVPEDIVPLARSGESSESIEIIRHRNLPIVGLQFHPEMLHTETNNRLWNAAISLVAKAKP